MFLNYNFYILKIIFLFYIGPSKENDPTMFCYPQASIMFKPKHGDVCVFRPSKLLHCIWGLLEKNQLRLIFFQKCSV